MREVKVYDFFCGVGGVTRGLSDAGLTVVAGIDIDEKCRRTFEHNNRLWSSFTGISVR